MGKVTQENRILNIATPLGKDYLLIEELLAEEAVSQLFSYQVRLFHDEEEAGTNVTVVDPKSLLGKQVSIEVKLPDDTKRYFSGLVNRFSAGFRNGRFSVYNATIVPQAWLLTQREQSRIFQQKSVPDILKAVFDGLSVDYKLTGTYEPRNYCVQYRESDWSFAARLMEEEGMFFFFTHSDGSHKMVVGDNTNAFPVCSGSGIPFFAELEQIEGFQTSIHQFDLLNILQTGAVTFRDHNFELPNKNLEAQAQTHFVVAENTKLESYDFPGGYARKYDGVDPAGGDRASDLEKIWKDNKRRANNVMAEFDANHETVAGVGTACTLTAGHKFELNKHTRGDLNGNYMITSVTHRVQQSPTYVTDNVVPFPYDNHFRCVKVEKITPRYCPPRTTPQPVVLGSQTATVVGPAGEEIFVDKYGRVKVQFHWDRQGQNNAQSSCWVRVAQSWAGKKWGTMFIPRIGMEVVVDFLEGNPDQPIITGCVYNAETMPPYTLPDEKTKSTIKSNSSKGGGGFNEIRFEDKKDSEQIFIHAQKNQDIRVENDNMEWIGRDRHLIVKRDQIEEVKQDKHLKIAGNQTEQINGNVHLKVNSNKESKIGIKYAVDSGTEIHLKAGITTTIEAGTSLTLKVGGNFINISPAGVAIKGTMILLNSGGAAGSGGGASPGSPKEPTEADKAEPGETAARPSAPPPKMPEALNPLIAAAHAHSQNPQAPSVEAALQQQSQGLIEQIPPAPPVEPKQQPSLPAAVDSASNTVSKLERETQEMVEIGASLGSTIFYPTWNKLADVRTEARKALADAKERIEWGRDVAEDMKSAQGDALNQLKNEAAEAKASVEEAQAKMEEVRQKIEEGKKLALADQKKLSDIGHPTLWALRAAQNGVPFM